MSDAQVAQPVLPIPNLQYKAAFNWLDWERVPLQTHVRLAKQEGQ